MTKRGGILSNELHFGQYEEEYLSNPGIKNGNFIIKDAMKVEENDKVDFALHNNSSLMLDEKIDITDIEKTQNQIGVGSCEDASATVDFIDYDDEDGIQTVHESQLQGYHGHREDQTVSQVSDENDLSVTQENIPEFKIDQSHENIVVEDVL